MSNKKRRLQITISDPYILDILELLTKRRGGMKLGVEMGLAVIASKGFLESQNPVSLRGIFSQEIIENIASGKTVSEILKTMPKNKKGKAENKHDRKSAGEVTKEQVKTKEVGSSDTKKGYDTY